MVHRADSAFIGLARVALLRLDHRVRFYLWKACNDAKVNPDDFLKTRLLEKITYEGLLDLTRDVKLEDPPLEVPPIQGELLEYARARTLTRLTPKVKRYFKQVLLHAEHRLFGCEPDFRELQLDARFIPTLGWTCCPFRRLVCFKPPPHAGEEIAPSFSIGDGSFEYLHVLFSVAKSTADAGGLSWPSLRNPLPLFNFQLPHVEELLQMDLEIANGSRVKPVRHADSDDDEDPWPGGKEGPWPVDKEDDDLPADVDELSDYDSYDSYDYEDFEDSRQPRLLPCEYGRKEKYDPLIGFRGVLQIPLLLVTHYMRKQVMAVLGRRGLGIMELAVMNAIGSRERRFEYAALKEAFPVLPTAEEARRLMASPVQLTWTEAMADMPLTVGRALFAIGVDEVFKGDRQMQDAAEAAAEENAEPFWKANFIGRGITCSEKGEIRIRYDDDGTIKWMLQTLESMRSEGKLPSACDPSIPVFDFAMRLLRERHDMARYVFEEK